LNRLAIGLVGCGGMGRRHLQAYRALRGVGVESFELAAVCDPRIWVAEEAAGFVEEIFGLRPAVYSDADDLIASGSVQALDVVTDPRAHHTIAVPALDAGLHVICEKPLGLTVRACRAIVDAAARSGAVLATAENYRRDAPNRLARAVIDSRMLGDLHLMMQIDLGGDQNVIISPWRHVHEAGSIALDMGVHYADIVSYFLGELVSVSGTAFIAEPLRVLPPGATTAAEIEEVSPGVIRATGDDSLVAQFESASGVLAQLAFVPSGPGRHWLQRSVHGRAGSMSAPPDRSGGAVIVRLGDRTLSGSELRRELGGFELEGVSAAFFGPTGTEYDRPFAEIDAALIAIELDDFICAVAEGRAPEVDGVGGLRAVAAVWGVAESRRLGTSVRIDDVANGTISAAQDNIDDTIGLK
jgi:predicted dehydrogenase